MDEVMTPDARDLQAARQGGEAGAAAFTHLYDRHAGVVLALCRRHTRLGFGDDAEADDALQETFRLLALRECDAALLVEVVREQVVPKRGERLARDLLREMKATEKVADIRGDGYVFKNKSGHAPFYYRKAWGELRDAAKVGDVRFHDLRHLAASHLAMAGATQRELMEVLGHKSASMTRRYSHFFDQHVAELGDRLQARLFGDADK